MSGWGRSRRRRKRSRVWLINSDEKARTLLNFHEQKEREAGNDHLNAASS